MSTNASLLTRLMLAERPSLLRLAQRILGNAAGAEDVAQGLWLRIQRVEDDPPIANKRAYLYRLAANLAIDHAKADARRDAVHAEAAAVLTGAETGICGERTEIARDELRRIAAAVTALPERTRQVFVLSRVEGLPQREIAARLGISRPTVEKHLARAFDAVVAVRGGE